MDDGQIFGGRVSFKRINGKVRLHMVRKRKYITEIEYCVACGEPPPVALHHWRTRGSGGTDDPWNLCPLCAFCHEKVHKSGSITFARENKPVNSWLLKNGWHWDPLAMKWLHF